MTSLDIPHHYSKGTQLYETLGPLSELRYYKRGLLTFMFLNNENWSREMCFEGWVHTAREEFEESNSPPTQILA